MPALPRLALLAPLLLATPAGAQESDWLTRDTLTGDWGGARTALADKGVTVEMSWVMEGLGNVSGGMRQGAVYDGFTELYVDFDLEKLAGWKGGSVHVSGYSTQGHGLSAKDIGNLLTVSSIESAPVIWLGEVYLDQKLGDTLALRIGQLGVDQDFWISDTAGVFVNSTFGWAGINGVNLPNGGNAVPLPTPGVRLRWSPDAAWSVQGAVYNGNPLGGSGGNPNGLDFPVNDGVLAIVEASYTSAPKGGLSGTYKVGAWYNSESFDNLSTAANGVSLADPTASGPLRQSGMYSLYAMVDHQLWAKPGADGEGLSGFLRVAVAPEQDRSPVTFYVDAGLAYTGLLPGRPNDILGLGFAYAGLSSSLSDLDRATNAVSGVDGPVRDYEAVIELTYQAAVTPWLTVQPFFQYVIHPGGNVPNPDGTDPAQAMGNAAVFGMRSTVVF